MSTQDTRPVPAWSVATLPPIENPNSSGQGYCAAHLGHPLHAVCVAAGYTYSHSVPVGYAGGKRIVHCYKLRPGAQDEHNVSFAHSDTSHSWQTSASCASGHKHSGFGAHALAKHLAGKARRMRGAQSIVNRWGHKLTVGMPVRVCHPRGGHVDGTIARIETSGAYAKAYGPRVILATGGSASVDDCKPLPSAT